MSDDRRTEVLSLRLSADEKRRLTEAAERHGQGLSDWARDQLVRHVDDPFVSPGQTIMVSLPPTVTDRDIVQTLRAALALAESKAAS